MAKPTEAGETGEALVELTVYKCPNRRCYEGRIIVDWDAYNNGDMRRAYANCDRCKGRGFILREKLEREASIPRVEENGGPALR